MQIKFKQWIHTHHIINLVSKVKYKCQILTLANNNSSYINLPNISKILLWCNNRTHNFKWLLKHKNNSIRIWYRHRTFSKMSCSRFLSRIRFSSKHNFNNFNSSNILCPVKHNNMACLKHKEKLLMSLIRTLLSTLIYF